MTRRYIDIAEVAKIIRGELKKAFPEIKFSVRISRYSMGSHVSVRWTDGPARRQVDAKIGRYYGTGFDGMTDSTTHHDGELNGEIVHFAGSKPDCVREISEAFKEACKRAWPTLPGDKRCDLLTQMPHYWQDDYDNLDQCADKLAHFVGADRRGLPRIPV